MKILAIIVIVIGLAGAIGLFMASLAAKIISDLWGE